MTNYPIVPGRGLVTKTAKELRLDYLQNLGLGLESVSQVGLQSDDIKIIQPIRSLGNHEIELNPYEGIVDKINIIVKKN